MTFFRLLAALAVTLTLAACGGGTPSKFRTYDGPPVTQILVSKSDRKMYLLNGDTALKSYDIGLGFSPKGHKQFEGDGKTPEGLYYIDRRNPKSSFHLSLGLSYPNANDRAFAHSHRRSPGGDIFIHGYHHHKGRKGDWTEGCIAVTNDEMEEIYSMVRNRTPIYVKP